jgi:REP element-mobilizing transposase RayT
MAFLKKNFSRDINHVLKGDIPECRLSGSQYSARYDRNFEIPHLIKYRTELLKKYPKEIPFPPFKWQKSFHFHIIEDDQDLHNHIEYIKSQWIKHGLEENKWCYLSDSFK